MYTNVFYDAYHAKIFLTEVINGEMIKSVHDINYDYYVRDSKEESDIKDIYGTPVKQKFCSRKSVIRTLKESGAKLYQSDFPEDNKFLLRRYGNTEIRPNMADINICYLDIECETEGEFPKPEEAKFPVNLITVKFSKTGKTYTFGKREYTGDSPTVENYVCIPDEKRMLEKFIKFLRKQNVSIHTNWNGSGFDWPYLIRRSLNLGVDVKKFSPHNLEPILIETQNNKSTTKIQYKIPGLHIVDYMDLYKWYTIPEGKKESYTLQYTGMDVLKEGKLELEGGVYTIWKTDWNRFVEYNIQDVLLIEKIEKKLQILEFAIEICYSARIPFDKIFSTIAILTGELAKFLWSKNIVIPDKETFFKEEYPGGYVYSSPGYYKNTISDDAESLYPTLIRQFNISPETLVLNPINEEGLIKTPVPGVFYRKDKPGVIPQIAEKLFDERKHSKNLGKICFHLNKKKSDLEISEATGFELEYVKNGIKQIREENGTEEYYNKKQKVRKILVNSLYGVLGSTYFHFYNIHNAKAVTATGREFIQYCQRYANTYFQERFHLNKKFFPNDEGKKIDDEIVFVVDTDSCFLNLDPMYRQLGNGKDFVEWADEFDKTFLKFFWKKVSKKFADDFNTEDLMNFKREKIISDQIVWGKKKYVCRVLDNEGKRYDEPQDKYTGFETQRSDTPLFCRQRLKEVIKYVLDTQGKEREKVIDLIKQIKKDFNDQTLENISVSKSISDYDKYAKSTTYYLKHGLKYEKGTPIHIRAAMNYNYLIAKHKWPYIYIGSGSKLKYVYVKSSKNELMENVIAFTGQFPKQFGKIFEIDYDLMFEKTFSDKLKNTFEVLDWGNLQLQTTILQNFMEW